ncbi:MAG: DUF2339 domain-containing protein, partial [Phycisphaerae bacterium]|nr:DUF2339 domain-containing protein [Phycisphaerae bacterium]
ALAVAHLGLDAQDHPLKWCTVGGIELTRQFILALSLVPVGQLLARFFAIGDEASDFGGTAASIVATAVLCAAAVAGLPAMDATGLIVTYAWLLVLCDRPIGRIHLREQGIVLVAGCAAKWICDAFYLRMQPEWNAADARPIANSQFIIAIVVAIAIALIPWIPARESKWKWLSDRRGRLPAITLAMLLIVVAGSFEIERIIGQMNGQGRLGWSLAHSTQVGFTVWWIVACGGMLGLMRAFDQSPGEVRYWPIWIPTLIRLIAIKYLIVDVLYFGVFDNPASMIVIFNPSVGEALVVLIALMLDVTDWPGTAVIPARSKTVPLLLAALVVWLAGSIEIIRSVGVARLGSPSASLSVYWSVVAIAAVMSGFVIRNAPVRFFGLGLFALTCLKVVVIDMSELQTGYRVLSFMGLGGLLIGTSVLYGKFGEALSRERPTMET